MKVRFTKEALADLDTIFAYIAKDNPAAAARVVERISQAADLLREFPRMGRRSSEPGVFEAIVRGLPYIVVHELDRKRGAVVVLRVYHAARKRPTQRSSA